MKCSDLTRDQVLQVERAAREISRVAQDLAVEMISEQIAPDVAEFSTVGVDQFVAHIEQQIARIRKVVPPKIQTLTPDGS